MIKFSIALTIFLSNLLQINGHGMVMDPVSRSSAWKKNFTVPPNYDDSGVFCGGIGIQFDKNNGKCGVCGDDYSLNRPRPNENGGIYGTGVIVKTYKPKQNFTVTIDIKANHMGKFWFSVCPLSDPKEMETEDCFDKYPIKLANSSQYFRLLPKVEGEIMIELTLPKNLTCKHCVFRWHWKAENSWGECEDKTEEIGCGQQEHYRNCSDISIEEEEEKNVQKPSTEKTTEKTTERTIEKNTESTKGEIIENSAKTTEKTTESTKRDIMENSAVTTEKTTGSTKGDIIENSTKTTTEKTTESTKGDIMENSTKTTEKTTENNKGDIMENTIKTTEKTTESTKGDIMVNSTKSSLENSTINVVSKKAPRRLPPYVLLPARPSN